MAKPVMASGLVRNLALSLVLAGCSGGGGGEGSGAAETPAAAVPATVAASSAGANPAPAAAAVACTDFRADLEDSDMVRIYYAAASLPPPHEKWAERILSRLDRNLPPEEAWSRATAESDAQWNAVKELRCITLRTDAQIERYDANRGGLIVGALGPDLYYHFSDYGDRVRLKLRNATAAEVWKMPPERGQALAANNDLWGTTLVARVRIVGARPTQEGGVMEGEVVSYDIVPRERSRAAMETVEVEG